MSQPPSDSGQDGPPRPRRAIQGPAPVVHLPRRRAPKTPPAPHRVPPPDQSPVPGSAPSPLPPTDGTSALTGTPPGQLSTPVPPPPVAFIPAPTPATPYSPLQPSAPTPGSAGSPTTAYVPPIFTGPHPPYGPTAPMYHGYPPRDLSHRRRLSPGGVVALVAVLVLVSLVAYSLGHVTRPQAAPPPGAVVTPEVTSAAPTARSTTTPAGSGTPTKGFTYDGSSITGPGFAARLPDSWWVASGNGTYNDGEAVSSIGRFYYFAGGTDPATVVCPRVVDSMKGSQSDAGTTIDPTPWGGVDAVTVDLLSTDKTTGAPVAYTVYCVDIPAGGSASLVAVSNYANQQRTRDAARTFLASWVWT